MPARQNNKVWKKIADLINHRMKYEEGHERVSNHFHALFWKTYNELGLRVDLDYEIFFEKIQEVYGKHIQEVKKKKSSPQKSPQKIKEEVMEPFEEPNFEDPKFKELLNIEIKI